MVCTQPTMLNTRVVSLRSLGYRHAITLLNCSAVKLTLPSLAKGNSCSGFSGILFPNCHFKLLTSAFMGFRRSNLVPWSLNKSHVKLLPVSSSSESCSSCQGFPSISDAVVLLALKLKPADGAALMFAFTPPWTFSVTPTFTEMFREEPVMVTPVNPALTGTTEVDP